MCPLLYGTDAGVLTQDFPPVINNKAMVHKSTPYMSNGYGVSVVLPFGINAAPVLLRCVDNRGRPQPTRDMFGVWGAPEINQVAGLEL